MKNITVFDKSGSSTHRNRPACSTLTLIHWFENSVVLSVYFVIFLSKTSFSWKVHSAFRDRSSLMGGWKERDSTKVWVLICNIRHRNSSKSIKFRYIMTYNIQKLQFSCQKWKENLEFLLLGCTVFIQLHFSHLALINIVLVCLLMRQKYFI